MWQLAVDLGTRFVKAARLLDGVAEPISLAGRPEMPAAVFLHRDGTLRAGWDAWDRGAVAPSRMEATPRRWLANGSTMVIGGTVVPVTEALGAVLRCAVDAATVVVGDPPSEVVLTYPGGWSRSRLGLLEQAAEVAAAPLAGLVPEPVAAVAGAAPGLAPGRSVAVYDLGAGTLSTCVVRRVDDGFRMVGRTGGHERLGGDVFDERLLLHLAQRLAADEPGAWDGLLDSADLQWQRARLTLQIHVRQAREQLSLLTEAQVPIPMTGRSVTVTRATLESLVQREVEQAAETLRRTVIESGTDPAMLEQVLVLGGAAQMPLVQWSLLQRFGERVLFVPDPGRTVALGAARLARYDVEVDGTASAATARVSTAVSSRPSSPAPGVAWPRSVGSAAGATPPTPTAPPHPPPPPPPPPPALPSTTGVPTVTDRLLLVLVVVLAAALGVAVGLLIAGGQ